MRGLRAGRECAESAQARPTHPASRPFLRSQAMTAPPSPSPETESGRAATLQRRVIRFCALVLFTGLPAVILPGVALEKFAWLMKMDRPALDPLTVYLSGNTGFIYVALGIVFWMVSNDVVRHRTFVKAFGWILLLGGPIYLSIDLQAGLLLWWVLLDSVSCFVMGLALLLTSRKIR